MNFKKTVNIILVLIFFLLILIPLLKVNLATGKISDAENRTLASFPKIIDPMTRKIKGSGIRKEFESWINDNIGFRDFLVKLNAYISVYYFNTSPNNEVKIGKNGWYFYTLDNNIEIANGTFPLTENDLLEIKEAQELIQQGLKEKGIEYVLVLTPSKTSMYPENIAGISKYVKETPIDIVTKYLRENTTINVINTKDDLINAKKEDLVYLKTDTHWNDEGAYLAYKSIISKISNYNFFNKQEVYITKKEGTRKGQFSSMMGNVNLLPPEPVENLYLSNSNTNSYNDNELLKMIEKYQSVNLVLSATKFLFNNNIHNGKIIIFGDSFFAGYIIIELLAEHFQKTFFINSNYISNNLLSEIMPNIVIYERTERYIRDLKYSFDPLLLPLKKPLAQIINHDTPTKIIPGKKYTINVTVKNIGTENWSKIKKINFTVFQNGKDDNYKVLLPEGITIKPGEEYTFTLKDLIIKKDANSFEYLMIQEGVGYFGERKIFNIEDNLITEGDNRIFSYTAIEKNNGYEIYKIYENSSKLENFISNDKIIKVNLDNHRVVQGLEIKPDNLYKTTQNDSYIYYELDKYINPDYILLKFEKIPEDVNIEILFTYSEDYWSNYGEISFKIPADSDDDIYCLKFNDKRSINRIRLTFRNMPNKEIIIKNINIISK